MIRLKIKNLTYNIKAGKIPILWSGRIDKYEYATGEELLPPDQSRVKLLPPDQSRVIEQANFSKNKRKQLKFQMKNK